MATETSTHPTRNVPYRAIGQAVIVIAMSRPGPAQIKPKIPKHVLCFGAPKRRLAAKNPNPVAYEKESVAKVT